PPAPVATVTVSPDTVTITVGGSVTLVATLLDVLNNVLTGRTVTWSSSDTTVAIVDEASGAVHGVNPGTAIITATSEGKSGASTVTVNPAPPPGR
ncbi:MAG: Ig-like domain-containing protein, partial [Gemmatimonadaceae bacterium]|nr:Ig-like domain-containing protein [Gemmatimonadaceae bacterium]